MFKDLNIVIVLRKITRKGNFKIIMGGVHLSYAFSKRKQLCGRICWLNPKINKARTNNVFSVYPQHSPLIKSWRYIQSEGKNFVYCRSNQTQISIYNWMSRGRSWSKINIKTENGAEIEKERTPCIRTWKFLNYINSIHYQG